MVDWESLYKWLEGKLTFQAFIIGATLFLMGIAKMMTGQSGTTARASSRRASPKYRYAGPPEKCYCEKCGSEIDMKQYGFYGKHCSEIRCPICGGRMWRFPRA